MSDQSLHIRLKKRESKAYDEIMDLYTKLVYKVAYGVLKGVGTPEDVEEVCSDTFIYLWLHPEKYNPDKGGLKTYLCVIARSKAIDRLRKIKRVTEVALEDDHIEEGFEEVLIQKHLVREVYENAKSMKEPDREIFILRYFYQMKPQEIALKLSLPVKTISNLLYQGKKCIQEKMKGAFNED